MGEASPSTAVAVFAELVVGPPLPRGCDDCRLCECMAAAWVWLGMGVGRPQHRHPPPPPATGHTYMIFATFAVNNPPLLPSPPQVSTADRIAPSARDSLHVAPLLFTALPSVSHDVWRLGA